MEIIQGRSPGLGRREGKLRVNLQQQTFSVENVVELYFSLTPSFVKLMIKKKKVGRKH